ncbi:hypothetical protein BHE74_00039070 [Ensete ventricosum]|uniref:Uncharacterized protein n=1 Tax=Ensete ventricosum TaxID=4639 RepID=A0A445M9J0_ENSVE|nr:hypothetical protein BHE74_00039070 [Ensete ventricosum]RZR70913.1 hypothetical protein BHM03_00002322 [Ensete ventricosum]
MHWQGSLQRAARRNAPQRSRYFSTQLLPPRKSYQPGWTRSSDTRRMGHYPPTEQLHRDSNESRPGTARSTGDSTTGRSANPYSVISEDDDARWPRSRETAPTSKILNLRSRKTTSPSTPKTCPIRPVSSAQQRVFLEALTPDGKGN